VRNGDNVIVFRTFAKVLVSVAWTSAMAWCPRGSQDPDRAGLDNPHLFNRLAVAAASASLKDPNYVAGVTRKVAEERELWFALFRELKLKFTPSRGNFVFLRPGCRMPSLRRRCSKQGIVIVGYSPRMIAGRGYRSACRLRTRSRAIRSAECSRRLRRRAH